MRWPEDGIPHNPAAWLTTTAYRRALDVLRRRRVEGQKLREVAAMASNQGSSGVGLTRTPMCTATTSYGSCSPAATRRCRSPVEWRSR